MTSRKQTRKNDLEVVNVPDVDSSSWRLRDAAHRLLIRRYGRNNGDHDTNHDGDDDDDDDDNNNNVAPLHAASSMFTSSAFDEELCLERIRRDRVSIVQAAFDAAASAVLEAMDKTLKQRAHQLRRKSLSLQVDDLPPFLFQWLQLEQVRLASMERAHSNKEYAKRPPMQIPDARKGKGRPKSLPDQKTTSSEPEQVASSNNNNNNNNDNNDSISSNNNNNAKEAPPKFTRNTPASSAAALDSRSMNSRAILCTAGNVSFDALTPALPGCDSKMDVTDIPQNPTKNQSQQLLSDKGGEETGHSMPVVNMGTVVVEAQALGQRAIAVTTNACRRAAQRSQYRKDNAKFVHSQYHCICSSSIYNPSNTATKSLFHMTNPFQWKSSADRDYEDAVIYVEENAIPYQPNTEAITEPWIDSCLPRLVKILDTGTGHLFYHDVHWSTRHGRIAHLLQEMANKNNNYGTHLIITTEPDVKRFAQEFQPVRSHFTLVKTVLPGSKQSLRALAYTGNREQRRKLRSFFTRATGLYDSPFHVLITSYQAFLDNYLHFCQMPYENVIVDDGAAWVAAARTDPNSPIGTLWETALWSTKDHVGLAGTSFKKWNFLVDDIPPKDQKDAWIGLTARSRILTGAPSQASYRFSGDVIPCAGLVEFIAPHFANVVREEWDRSRIQLDATSMNHFRKLLARSTVVHQLGVQQDMRALAMKSLNGELPAPDRNKDPPVPDFIPDESFVNDFKVAFSRRAALLWLGDPETSWLRYELGIASFTPILDAQSKSNTYGYFCEEVVPASSFTSAGPSGQVSGNMAYRFATRCNRHFGSEQGLRQHLSAFHAPPNTWLCRTCGTDCITSQARTYHERTCGQTLNAQPGDPKDSKGGTGPRQNYGSAGVVGKKKGKKSGSSSDVGAATADKDPDGSFRVPGYRGVWVNPKGKHFVKIKGTKLIAPGRQETMYFDNIEEAAKGHDVELKKQAAEEENDDEDAPKIELNYKEDGTRILYEDAAGSSSAGLGGGANNVVPALSVINIKDLPAHVKPLLRDPRQTSRTGGNSKRHVYAYRGVCRQARKGHDRWQSQISFMGVNHYLGTFDSEWDAAAIYSWAHLILYGEEATKQAQKEGEEAAAAYEQEKKDIAAGKIVVPPKPEKKAKPNKEKKTADDKKAVREQKKKERVSAAAAAKKAEEGNAPQKKPGRKRNVEATTTDDAAAPAQKKRKPGRQPSQVGDNNESLLPILSKGVYRAWSLAPREDYQKKTDAELMETAVSRIEAVRKANYAVTEQNQPASVDDMLRSCLPQSSASAIREKGAALLLGLSSNMFGWDLETFVSSRVFDSAEQQKNALAALTSEVAANERFCTLLQGPLCIIGNASPTTRRAHKALGLGLIPIGSSVGEIDCHIGGILLSCSEMAATIRFAPTTAGDFQFAALSDEDTVTLNGKRITPGMGSFPLLNEDVCTVGARVFVFLIAQDK